MAPPSGLAGEGLDFWTEIMAHEPEYILRPDQTRLLTEICRTIERIAELDAYQERSGQIIWQGAAGQDIISPMISEARMLRGGLSAMLKVFELPDSGGAGKTMAEKRSEHQRMAAKAKWSQRGQRAA